MRAVYEHKSNEYWRTEIAASNGNMKRLWHRLHGDGEEPSGETGTHMADGFAAFFMSKESIKFARLLHRRRRTTFRFVQRRHWMSGPM